MRKERRGEDWVDGRVGTTKKVDRRVSLPVGMGRKVDSYTQLLRPALTSTSCAYRSSALLFSQGAQGGCQWGSGCSDGLLEMQAEMEAAWDQDEVKAVGTLGCY